MELRKRDESETKEFVDVEVLFSAKDASITPQRIFRENGQELAVMKVLDVRRAASLRAGGQGMRYHLRVFIPQIEANCDLFLFEDAGYWFLECTAQGRVVGADGVGV